MLADISKYRNIIFDFGGVIINIDYSLLVKSFVAIGLPHFEEYFSQANQRTVFDDYEKGLITSAEFRNTLKEHCFPGTTDEQIDSAWNAMILDVPEERLNLLKRLKTHYRTFLLSNTNEIHIHFIFKNLEKSYGIKNLDDHFEKVYLSYQMGMRKPDAEIFERIMKENGLKASETLFIEDSEQHVRTAKAMGISCYLLDPGTENIAELLH